jgi:hypothetical protein
MTDILANFREKFTEDEPQPKSFQTVKSLVPTRNLSEFILNIWDTLHPESTNFPPYGDQEYFGDENLSKLGLGFRSYLNAA